MGVEQIPGGATDATSSVALALFLLAGVLAAADRGAVFLERWGPRVFGLRGIARRWARNTVEREERDEALAVLAERADAILAALGSNGKPLHDRVSELQEQVDTRLDRVDDRLDRGDRRMGRIEQRLEVIEERRAS